MTHPLERVQFVFESDGDPAGGWQVTRLAGHEAVAELYEHAVDLAHEDVAADADALLGQSATLTIRRGLRERLVRGVVRRVEALGLRGARKTVRVLLVPALWSLSKRVDSRIFQKLDAQKILKQVLEAPLGAFGRSVRFDLTRTPAVREYCVQYRESDLDFVRRLTEEEGISWYFDHAGDAEVMVLTDSNGSFAQAPSVEGPLAVAGPEADTRGEESVRHFECARELQTTSVVARDFDWTRPTLDLTRESRGADANGMDREVYDYPAGLTLGPYDAGAKQYTGDDGNDRARIRREARASRDERYEAEANAVGLTAGTSFELTGHTQPELDRKYVLLRVELTGEAPEHLYQDSHDAGTTARLDERFANRLTCVRDDAVFRARQNTPRPRVAGAQTATVVGPAGEEIYTDEHGRIKVQFHWDRFGARDENSSCWVRVAQNWAGAGWGFVFIPRIGMEVVVTFLEGDPDRPLVTGCVYNGENRPPYTLPDEKTKSTLKTNSSPTSGGYNELRFEDLAGSEEIYLQAQKDFNEYVKHDHTTTVDNDQTNTVHGSQCETVDGNQTLTAHTNRTKTIDGNESVHIKGQQNITIDGGGSGGDDPPPAPGAGLFVTGEYTVEATSKITLKVGGSTIVIDGGSITCTSGGNAVMKLDANADLHASGGGQVYLTADADMHSAAGSQVYLNADADMHSSGSAQVYLDANVDAHSAAGSQVLLDANAAMTTDAEAFVQGGATATVAAPTATLAGGGGSVEAGGAGVTAAGGQVNVSGGMVNISGGLVKIN
jgi:type VI secretion system secreted protein VgrG